jgi:hypothetical protein
MDVRRDARCASASEGATTMADQSMAARRCIGSERFGIEAHEAPVTDFPAQPSQKDGLGRMCKPHWNQYTTALRKAALARKAADGDVATTAEVAGGEPATGVRKSRGASKPGATKARKPRAVAEVTTDAASAAEA